MAQVFVGTALHDGEERLAIAVEGLGLVEMLHTTLQPSLRKSKTLRGILIVALSRRTLVERHHDVRSDYALGIHHVLRGEDMTGTVDMALKFTTLFGELTDAGEREYLETA